MKNNIKALRAKYNLTQEDLAQVTGVTRQTIIAIEADKYSPSLELAFDLALAFRTTVDDLFSPDANT